MADGEITVKLDAETREWLEAAAETAGRSVGDFVRDLIHAKVRGQDWADDVAAYEDFRRSGLAYSVEEAMAHFDDAVADQLAKSR